MYLNHGGCNCIEVRFRSTEVKSVHVSSKVGDFSLVSSTLIPTINTYLRLLKVAVSTFNTIPK